MRLSRNRLIRTGIGLLLAGLVLILILAAFVILRTLGRTVMQVNIHQDKQLIYLSTFSEPPQFAIWLENPKSGELKTVFVTHRVAVGDWEGKANVPVALPQWFRLFRGENSYGRTESAELSDMVITGATPREDYFSIRVELKPGSEWICWIEMNLAGDFNDAFPEFDEQTLSEDEFSNGQPALLFRADVRAEEGMEFTPVLSAQSVWNDGEVIVEPVSDGVTTAKEVFDSLSVTISKPKPKLIDHTKIREL